MRDLFKDYKVFSLDPSRLRSKDFFANMLEYRHKIMEQFTGCVKEPSQFVCPLCHNKTYKEFLNYKDYYLFECVKCGLVSPNIDFSLIGHNVYDDKAYIKDTEREILDTFEYRKKTYAPERLQYILTKTGLKKTKFNYWM